MFTAFSFVVRHCCQETEFLESRSLAEGCRGGFVAIATTSNDERRRQHDPDFVIRVKIDISASETLALSVMSYGERATKKWSIFGRHGGLKEGRGYVHGDSTHKVRVSTISA